MLKTELNITHSSCIDFPNKFGTFKLHVFENIETGEYHTAIVKGEIDSLSPVLTRMHSECFTGDVFGSLRCDCGEQLETSMKLIEQEGSGVLLYLRQEGRGIGLPNKIKAYELQDEGFDTVEANLKLGFKDDQRSYAFAAEMLKQLGVTKVDLLTNNPKKIEELEASDLKVINRHSIEIQPNKVNLNYLKTKRDRMNHMILSDQH